MNTHDGRDWRCGEVYGDWEGIPLYDYPCQYSGLLPTRCCHQDCRCNALVACGKADVAEQLRRNWKAKDWLSNWGKMVYDASRHTNEPERGKRRKYAAAFVREIRRGKVGEGDAAIAGCWAGALI